MSSVMMRLLSQRGCNSLLLTRSASNYASTNKNMVLNKETRVICQGFTGKQGTFHSRQAIEYGTNMVGGVSPGKGGKEHLGLPVFNSVAEVSNKSQALLAGKERYGVSPPVVFCQTPYFCQKIT